MRGRRGWRAAVVALLGGALALVGSGPASASSCRFADGVVHARVDGGSALRMFAWPAGTAEAGQLWWADASDPAQRGFCGRATVRNTDRVVVTGSGRTGRLDYQQPHRPFGPGRSPEDEGVPEIEFVLRGGVSSFRLTGLGGTDGEPDTVRLGRRGADVNGDGDLDVRLGRRVARVELLLLGGDDVADARGGRGTGGAWSGRRPLVIDGGDGTDELHGRPGRDVLVGGDGPDALRGGRGDDLIGADDLVVDLVLDGGPGQDAAWYDDHDQPTGIEQRLVR